jgi:soluble epoxide hydrolase / lipid-phosphate phosphatase
VFIAIPRDNYEVKVPTFFGAALQDVVCLSELGKQATAKYCKDVDTVVHEYDGGHWIVFSHAKPLANDLHSWIQDLKVKGKL